jgi:hypothetical protein
MNGQKCDPREILPKWLINKVEVPRTSMWKLCNTEPPANRLTSCQRIGISED